MRPTTKKLIDRLYAGNLRFFRVDVAERADDSEVIHLQSDYVLSIDEDDVLPFVTLEVKMEIGGNVLITDWIVDSDSVLEQIASAANDLKVYGQL